MCVQWSAHRNGLDLDNISAIKYLHGRCAQHMYAQEHTSYMTRAKNNAVLGPASRLGIVLKPFISKMPMSLDMAAAMVRAFQARESGTTIFCRLDDHTRDYESLKRLASIYPPSKAETLWHLDRLRPTAHLLMARPSDSRAVGMPTISMPKSRSRTIRQSTLHC